MFREASAAGARRCLVGIGGSATNDAGFGLAIALGWRFLDARSRPIESWIELDRLERIEPPPNPCRFDEVLVAVDVQNPLLGPSGCSRIYGPQKGLRPEDFAASELALGRLADSVRALTGEDIAARPGAGAAGGLGFGLCAFLHGTLTPGFDLFAESGGFRERIAAADLVVTAEGSIDASSLMGKGVGGVAALCRELRKPCLALAGMVSSAELLRGQFSEVHALVPDRVSREEAFAEPGRHLAALASKVATGFSLRALDLSPHFPIDPPRADH